VYRNYEKNSGNYSILSDVLYYRKKNDKLSGGKKPRTGDVTYIAAPDVEVSEV
jgi:hypothetical protein